MNGTTMPMHWSEAIAYAKRALRTHIKEEPVETGADLEMAIEQIVERTLPAYNESKMLEEQEEAYARSLLINLLHGAALMHLKDIATGDMHAVLSEELIDVLWDYYNAKLADKHVLTD